MKKLLSKGLFAIALLGVAALGVPHESDLAGYPTQHSVINDNIVLDSTNTGVQLLGYPTQH